MKKIYNTPVTMAFEMRHENIIATTIPKDDSNPIDDGNKDGFEFAPKQENDWTNN